MRSKVYVKKSEYANIYPTLQSLMMSMPPLKFTGSKSAIIKLNLADIRTPETGTVTHPLFLNGVLHYLRENFENLRIYVVESDATMVLADKAVQWLGFVPILQKWDAEFVNLSKGRVINRDIDGRYFKKIPVAEIFEIEHIFITLPKLKTNVRSVITCCLKNQFGCFPEVEKAKYHPRLDDVIADVNKTLRPNLCLIDAITGMGGTQGPSFGVPVPLRAVIASTDPVAADSYCARLMGFNPWFIGHIRKSSHSAIGSMRYKVQGDEIEKIDFEIGKLEFRLLRYAVRLNSQAHQRFRTQGGKRG